MKPRPSPPSTPVDLVERAGKIIALVAGLAAFVYIAGAAVLAVRLDAEGLPASEVVTSLPRELLVGVGLQYVVAPALALALVSGLEIYILRWLGNWKGHWRARDFVVAVIVGLVLTAIILWGLLSLQRGSWLLPRLESAELLSTSGWWIAFLVAYMLTLLALYLARAGERTCRTLELAALVALTVGVIAAVARVGYERTNTHLEEATVCVNDGGPDYEGVLIGETSDAVYLGIRDEDDRARIASKETVFRTPPRVLEIPKDRVGELHIGYKTYSICSVPRPTQDRERTS
jgi:hypothetical protein